MASVEAEELGKFRRSIGLAELPELAPIIATALDELIDLARSVGVGGDLAVEMAAALSAELHKRRPAQLRPSPMVGTA